MSKIYSNFAPQNKMNRIMSKSTKILWIIDLMAVEKLLLRGG